MSQNKKNNKKQETKAEPVLPTEPKDSGSVKTNDGNKSQIGSLRMRYRDYLDAVNKNINQELAFQEAAAAHGKTGLVSLRIDECKALVKVLSAMEAAHFLGWCVKPDSAAAIKLKKDTAATVAKLNGLADGSLKALSPEEKKAAQEEAEALTAQMAALEAKMAAISSSLNI